MKKIILLAWSFTSLLQADLAFVGDAVVPQDKAYYTHKLKNNNVEMIYTKDNMQFAQDAADIEPSLQQEYEKFYDWKLDERLYVGLISDNNQIPNAFSTQFPNNRQINYIGGSEMVDYFCSTSWLDTLLYHETAHNYQMNMKGSIVSRSLHAVFGNGTFILPFPVITPNVMENPFMTEGNAVLNESWHANGGRLYSGRMKVETALQAKAGNITPAYAYNQRFGFPYGEISYIQGGFFNLYMAKKYGLQEINSYFKYHSQDWWWPFFTNSSMESAVGSDFETNLQDFANEERVIASSIVKADGKRVAASQFFNPLGNSKDEVYFITNESGVRAPELVVINKQTQQLKKYRESWVGGKVIKKDGDYYTQGSQKISPTKIMQGLFSNAAIIKEGTESKMVQAYLTDGRAVYFDVASSYSQPQLYVGDTFYAQVNSSVIVDRDDNLYYFKQNGKRRTLYKNKEALYSYEGFYGLVCDVDSKGGIYFIANSKNGSTLYIYRDKHVLRASAADNIIDARVLIDDELLLAAMDEHEYYYVISALQEREGEPFDTKLFFEDKSYYGQESRQQIDKLDTSDAYYSFFDMHYSGANLYLGGSDNGVVGSLSINFADPLTQNSANVFVSRDESNVTVAGVGYANAQYLLNYMITAYSVIDKGGRTDVRDSGLFANATLPFLERGYYYGAVGVNYFQDYDTASREPLSATFTLYKEEQFGVSKYDNYLNYIQLYGVKERDDMMFGAEYLFKHDLPAEFYAGIGAKYSSSNSNTALDDRGVKISNIININDTDPATLHMPSLKNTIYMQNAGYMEADLVKVMNFSSYFFTFPFSLRREAIYAKYRYYNLTDFTNKSYEINEVRIGLELEAVMLNSLVFPISFEYIFNDNSDLAQREKLFFFINSAF